MLRRRPCHQSERLDKRVYCAWGSRNPEECLAAAPASDRDKRQPSGEISGNEMVLGLADKPDVLLQVAAVPRLSLGLVTFWL